MVYGPELGKPGLTIAFSCFVIPWFVDVGVGHGHGNKPTTKRDNDAKRRRRLCLREKRGEGYTTARSYETTNYKELVPTYGSYGSTDYKQSYGVLLLATSMHKYSPYWLRLHEVRSELGEEAVVC